MGKNNIFLSIAQTENQKIDFENLLFILKYFKFALVFLPT